mmetsp:Transcript_53591/g.125737  ORF Transcript_53591/g.125737 Transcript_53591/m.125737 type:complete len:239 (+) Transcript_53591:474-1190(+)
MRLEPLIRLLNLLGLELHLLHSLCVAFGLRFLVITKDGDLPVGIVVELKELLLRQLRPLGHIELVQLILQRVRGVVGTEDFRREIFHEVLKVFIQICGRDLVEDLLLLLLALDEALNIVEDLLGHFDAVRVPDGILTQEVEVDGLRRRKLQVLYAQRAAAHSISLLLRILLTANSQCELIDEVGRRGLLPLCNVPARPHLLIGGADAADDSHQALGTIVLQHIRLPFEAASSCETDVL